MSDFDSLSNNLFRNRITRRQVLWLIGACAVSAASGCATSPIGGGAILVGMNEDEEKAVDRKVAAQQFSQDLGAVQDASVSQYLSEVGRRLHSQSHRPQMPYSYRALNANYVNAYTFPGGSVGVTRGILVDLDDEAELAALIGHELGHVNARHAAQRQGQAMVASVAATGMKLIGAAAGFGGLADLGTQLGASVLLSSYSRDNEREADALGQEYMVRAGYPASGMVGLQQLLVDQEKASPGMLQTMFSTHPMSRERRDTARQLAESKYAASNQRDPGRERFMDNTASLRRIKPTIEACQKGEVAMAGKEYAKAEERFRSALKATPRDYAANLLLAKCLAAQDKGPQALEYARAATAIYPQEGQAQKLVGVLHLAQGEPAAAYEHLAQYDRLLPGDAGITFLQGVSLEGMGRRPEAAAHYQAYLKQVQKGKAAEHAYSRLQAWGYLKSAG